MDKIINVLKPPGMTSFDMVRELRRLFKIKKVGHTGTLDPDAAGVLPICLGRATKVADLILEKEKEYLCEMTLGYETDTYDNEGEIVSTASFDGISEEKIINAIKSQIGKIDQLPPKYSALKIKGKRMCDLVREGREDEIEIKSRQVEIFSIKLLDITLPKVTFLVHCSKGTYIRSLCKDLGDILGSKAHMSFLLRTKSGNFSIEESISLDELRELVNSNKLISCDDIEHNNFLNENEFCSQRGFFDIDFALSNFPKASIYDSALKYYSNGGTIDFRRFSLEKEFSGKYKLYRVYNDEKFLGIGKVFKVDNELMIKSVKNFSNLE